MKASEAGFLDFVKKSPQFVIPIYQRKYSWTDKECRQLWNDVVRAGSSKAINVHFVGSVVYVESGLSQVTQFSPLLVIDGQQRLTTVTLLVAALAEALGESEPVDGFSSRKLRNYYLVNPEEDGERRFKLLLSQTDKDSLLAIVRGNEWPAEGSLRIAQAYKLFNELLQGCNGDFADVCRGLSKLVVVDIALSREHDNPQLIFESMNSTGRQLSQADLIRNYVLMGLEPELQERLYEQFWRPMELEFGHEAYSSEFDGFMRHYLTGSGAWRIMAARSASRSTSTRSSISCPKIQTFQQAGGMPSDPNGRECRRSGCTRSATSRSRATTRSTATGPSRRSAIWRADSRAALSSSTTGWEPSSVGMRQRSRSERRAWQRPLLTFGERQR
jgi:hypothetical protein